MSEAPPLPEDTPATPAPGNARPRRKSIGREYVEALCLALVVAFSVRVFVLQAFKIPSTSMLPTLLVGDHLLVSKLHYGLRLPWGSGWTFNYRTPRAGDVIVFVPPRDRGKSLREQRDFVKRVVAVGGEVVEMREGGLYVNGRRRDLPHAHFTNVEAALEGSGTSDDFGPVRLRLGQFFVLGDNRGYSEDSRQWGPVEMADVTGKAVVIYWSWDALGGNVRWERVGDLIR